MWEVPQDPRTPPSKTSSGGKGAAIAIGLAGAAGLAALLLFLGLRAAAKAPSPPILKPSPLPIHPILPSPANCTLIVNTPDAMGNQIYSVLVELADARTGASVAAQYTRPASDTDSTAVATFAGLWPGYYKVTPFFQAGHIEFVPPSQTVYLPPGPPTTYSMPAFTEIFPYPKYICNPFTIKVVDQGGYEYPADRYYEVYWFYDLPAEELAFGDRTGPTDTITLLPTKAKYRIKLYSAFYTKVGVMPPEPLLIDTKDVDLYDKDSYTITMRDVRPP